MPARKKKLTQPPIDRTVPDPKPDITDVLHDSMGVRNRADAPEPAARPLLPNRWWENTTLAMEPQRPQPALIVSPAVAEVLNFGIDELVRAATRKSQHDLRTTQARLNSYQDHYDRMLQFLENAHDRLSIASPAEAVNEAIVAVRSAMQTLIEEPRP